MTKKQAANLIRNLTADIGKREHKDLWHYLEPLYKIREMLETEDEWTPCSESEKRCDKWENSKTLQE